MRGMNRLGENERSLMQLRDIAVDVAVAAAEVIRQTDEDARQSLAETTQTKTSAVDPVTVVDQAAEAFISERLATLCPTDGLIGEEGHRRSGTSGIDWIVDPIDGTVNFLYQIPRYAVSIAAVVEGQPVAGAVVNVATGTIYRAYRTGPAERATSADAGDWAMITASSCTDIHQALIATGFSYESSRRTAQAAVFQHVIPVVRDIRRMGAAALDLCSLAEGSVDGYYEHALHGWDWAAGAVIAAAAGAHLDLPPLDRPAGGGAPLVAAAEGVWDEFSRLLREAGGYRHL